MSERRQRSAERLGSERRKLREEEEEEEEEESSARATTPSRRVLTVQIPRTEETSQKKVLETIEKVFVSVLETSEIRAYDVSVTANEAENKKTYRYKAPAPSFPFVPKSIGKLSETGVCEITEVVVCDVKGKRIENVCETKGMLFADQFAVETFVGVESVCSDSRMIVCVVDVRLRWLKRLDNQRWLEALITKATELKIRRKYEILLKRVADDLKATATMTRNDDFEYLRQNVNYLFCVLVSILIFCLGFSLGGIDSSLSALWKL
jgi:hypothetical protein